MLAWFSLQVFAADTLTMWMRKLQKKLKPNTLDRKPTSLDPKPSLSALNLRALQHQNKQTTGSCGSHAQPFRQ